MEDKVGSKEKSFGMKFLQAYVVIFSVSTIQPTIEKVHISDIPYNYNQYWSCLVLVPQLLVQEFSLVPIILL
jgi:hypothetical protein